MKKKKKDENVTHGQDKKLSVETSSDQILELTKNKPIAAILTVLKPLKENVAIIIGEPPQKNGNLLKEGRGSRTEKYNISNEKFTEWA